MRKRRASKLDPYVPLIRELVLVKELSAVRVHEEIRALGYSGSYSVLKRFVRSFRPKPSRRPHLRFETEPGEQGQVDLSFYTVMLGETPTPVVCFSMIFGFSRWHFMRFTLRADVHSVCHGHVLAFEEARGVPYEILYDRMKQVVLESYADGVLFHPLFEAMMRHYGFRAVPLAPGYKEGKGKVENPFRYIEGNFLAGRTFHDLDDLNRQARAWLEQIARARVHRTTLERPIDRMEQERPRLIPLPARRFEPARIEMHRVGSDFCVPWNTNRYSAPPRYTGHAVTVRALEGTLQIKIGDEVLATHAIRETQHKRYIAPEHEAEFRTGSTSRHVLAESFGRLGSAADAFVEGLRQNKASAAGYHMSRILKLADRVGVLRVSDALRHAVRYGAFDATAIERIVDGRAPPERTVAPAQSETLPAHIAEYLKGAGEHQRSVDTYERATRAAVRESERTQDEKEDDHGH
jgi:transposase